MRFKIAAVCAASCVALAGCGTITQGTSQNITVTSTPPGAHCDLTRTGEHVATLDKTPGVVKVDKTKNDIMLTCDMAGYQQASVNLESGYGAGTFGNIILGGVIGWGIDSATGADNKYPSSASVQFIPASLVTGSPGVSTADPNPAIHLEPAAANAKAIQVPSQCTHEQQVQARIAKENGYTSGPKCD